jgi:hypothetical protein
LVVFPDGGCSVDGFVEDLPHKLAIVESLLGGVYSRVVLCLASGLGDASLLLSLVADMASVECKQVARRGLARNVVVGPIRIR